MKTASTSNLLGFYKKQGFRIKFPGGRERNDTFAAFCAVIRYSHPQQSWQTLVIPWRPRTKEEEQVKEMKFPELPLQVVIRELGEETGVILIKCIEIAHRSIKDKRSGYENQEHIQYVFCSLQFDSSNIRRTPSPSQPNIGTPFWVNIEALLREISIEHLWMLEEVKRYVDQLHIPRNKLNKLHLGKKDEPTAA